MKISSLPLRSLATTAACALLSASTFAQAPAPGTPVPAKPAAPAAPGAAPATTPATAPAATPAPKPLGPQEKNFIKNASKSIFYQLELAKAAKTAVTDVPLAKMRDDTIKNLTKAWEAIGKLATSKGEAAPAGELSAGDKADVERLTKLKDDKFVKQWIEDLLKESKRLDKDFESAGKTLQDVDVKTFAANYGPIVHGVFSDAERAEKAAKAPKKK